MTTVQVIRYSTPKATRGKVVAEYDSMRKAVEYIERADKGRKWSDPSHQAKIVEERSRS